MEYFSVGLNAFCLLGQSILQTAFVGRLTEKKLQLGYRAVYPVLVMALEWLAVTLELYSFLAIGFQMIVFYGFNRLALQNQPWVAGAAAILAVYIAQLAFGVVNSAEALLFPQMIGRPLLYLLVVLASVLALVFCAAGYWLVIKFLTLDGERQTLAFILLILPEVFLLLMELYILQTSYSYISVESSPELMVQHMALLILQLFGLAALFCTLYAYRRIRLGFQAQAELNSLAQAVQAQKTYVREVQLRYAQTQSFRHDVKNHLSVLGGLLRQGDLAAGLAYLQKISAAADTLSFPYNTGNAVVDILLAEKLGLAQAGGIKTEVLLFCPQNSGVDDFDLCVIIANALDNAINSCRTLVGEKAIRIKGGRQGDFYLLEFSNSCAEQPLSPPGIGLANIQMVAEKYQGAVQIEKEGRHFTLSVLLNMGGLNIS